MLVPRSTAHALTRNNGLSHGTILASPERLSIDRGLRVRPGVGRRHSRALRPEAASEWLGFQRRRQSAGRVVGGDPVRQRQMLTKPSFVILDPRRNGGRSLSVRKHCHDADRNQIAQQVSPIDVDRGSSNIEEFLEDRVDIFKLVFCHEKARDNQVGEHPTSLYRRDAWPPAQVSPPFRSCLWHSWPL